MHAQTVRHNSTQIPENLTPVEAQVADAIASGLTLSAAARKFDLHRSTLHNWVKSNPHFRAQIDTSRQFFRDSVRDELRELSTLALAKLRALLENPDTPPSVALRAALAVLNRPDSPGWVLPDNVQLPAAAAPATTPVPAPKPALVPSPPPAPAAQSQPLPKPQGFAAAPDPAKPIKWHKPCPCGIGIPYKLHCGKEAWLNYHPGQH